MLFNVSFNSHTQGHTKVLANTPLLVKYELRVKS